MEEKNQFSNEAKFFIPKNVKTRFEFMPGLGFKELFIILLFGAIGFSISYPLYLLTNAIPSYFIMILLILFGYLLTRPMPRLNKTQLDFLMDIKDYKLSQKRYFYRFGSARKKIRKSTG